MLDPPPSSSPPPPPAARLLLAVLLVSACEHTLVCAITNSNFNSVIRTYEDDYRDNNSSQVKTLQKEGPLKLSELTAAAAWTPGRVKDIPDNMRSGSSHGRGVHEPHDLLPNPPLYGYDDHGAYDHEYDHHLGYERPDHELQYTAHLPARHHGLYGHGHNYKHYDRGHALAVKSVLWPLAGVALLGAVAALVSNPVLLPLGVVAGRRRRGVEDAGVEGGKLPYRAINTDPSDDEDNADGKRKEFFKKRRAAWSRARIRPATPATPTSDTSPPSDGVTPRGVTSPGGHHSRPYVQRNLVRVPLIAANDK